MEEARQQIDASAGNQQAQRRHGRVACDEMRCTLGDVLDLSAGGAKILTRKHVSPATGDRFVLVLDGVDGPIRLLAQCVWRQPHRWRKVVVGIRFVDVPPDVLRHLRLTANRAACAETIRPFFNAGRKSA